MARVGDLLSIADGRLVYTLKALQRTVRRTAVTPCAAVGRHQRVQIERTRPVCSGPQLLCAVLLVREDHRRSTTGRGERSKRRTVLIRADNGPTRLNIGRILPGEGPQLRCSRRSPTSPRAVPRYTARAGGWMPPRAPEDTQPVSSFAWRHPSALGRSE